MHNILLIFLKLFSQTPLIGMIRTEWGFLKYNDFTYSRIHCVPAYPRHEHIWH